MDGDFPAAHSMDTLWFAVDEAGHVGLFDSGENGHVPVSVGEDAAWELLRRLGGPGPEDYDSDPYEQAKNLGLFYYYFDDENFNPIGTYERSVAPETPLHLDQLPPDLRTQAKRLQLTGTDFSRDERVQPLEHGGCVYWYEEDRAAYLFRDSKTVRPIPGAEGRFAEFVAQFREENPEEAEKYVFEFPREQPRRKEKDDGE